MSFWTFVFLIVIAGIAYDVWKKKHDAAQGLTRDWRGNPQPLDQRDERREAELENEVRQLRDQIAVLERIATDERGAKRLSAEIDALRQLEEDGLEKDGEGVKDDRQ